MVCIPFIYFYVGLRPLEIFKDAYEYNTLATHIITAQGYSLTGTTFTDIREPGYPLFVAGVYALFGVQNTLALEVVQTLLLSMLALLVYHLFARVGARRIGYLAGFVVTLLPSYGLYAHKLGTELLFTLLLGLILYLAMRIAERTDASLYWWIALGLVTGYATLVRVQLLLLLPVLLVGTMILHRSVWKRALRNASIAAIMCSMVVGSWVGYVHAHKGTWAITEGRQERALYIRAVRAQLSYHDLSRYAVAWVHRSLVGGQDNNPFLDANEYHQIDDIDYAHKATSTEAIAALKQWSIASIVGHPGHYLYGNLIEVMKLTYIEHDYSESINKYIRAAQYVFIYGLFFIGIVMLLCRHRERDMLLVAGISLIIIGYTIAVLTPFDTIPRYNTPFLFLYLMIGWTGVATYLRRRTAPNR
jgi:4-amino-4-deoxy-L-arabinose transferase-like glycosyltransferase